MNDKINNDNKIKTVLYFTCRADVNVEVKEEVSTVFEKEIKQNQDGQRPKIK